MKLVRLLLLLLVGSCAYAVNDGVQNNLTPAELARRAALARLAAQAGPAEPENNGHAAVGVAARDAAPAQPEVQPVAVPAAAAQAPAEADAHVVAQPAVPAQAFEANAPVAAQPAGPADGPNQCPICLDVDLDHAPQDNPVFTTPCNHRFCTHCMNEWRQHSNACPICRGAIDPAQPAMALNADLFHQIAQVFMHHQEPGQHAANPLVATFAEVIHDGQRALQAFDQARASTFAYHCLRVFSGTCEGVGSIFAQLMPGNTLEAAVWPDIFWQIPGVRRRAPWGGALHNLSAFSTCATNGLLFERHRTWHHALHAAAYLGAALINMRDIARAPQKLSFGWNALAALCAIPNGLGVPFCRQGLVREHEFRPTVASYTAKWVMPAALAAYVGHRWIFG